MIVNDDEIKSIWYIAQHLPRNSIAWIDLDDTWTSTKQIVSVGGAGIDNHEHGMSLAEFREKSALEQCEIKLKSKKRRSDRFRIARVFKVYKVEKELSIRDLQQ